MSEATRPVADYRTLEDLFTRELLPDARPIDPTPDALVSPVDGTVAAVGTTSEGCIALTPEQTLDLAELLGSDPQEYEVAVLYLSPTDYHRVHVAREGTAISWSYLPGTLWPVFPAAVRRVRGLFSRNERFVIHTQTSAGPLATVLVGAFGVGRITVAVTDRMSNDGQLQSAGVLEPPVALGRGDWLGTFHLGSTVILAAPVGTVTWECGVGDTLRMGARIGRLA